ncbi:MAG TPA: hypothetical protein VF179_08210 [Thermoanaerobaculia bacterium]|nr:hypothetical protein [Thermoanaerobaculia bacterium]
MSIRSNIARFLTLVLALAGAMSACARGPAAPEEGAVPRRETYAVEAYQVRLRQPVEMLAEGRKITVSEVVELRVTAQRPIPAQALDPVLMVGERPVTEYRYEAPNVLVFTEPVPAKLPARAPVSFQWGQGPGAAGRQPTGFTFERSKLERRVR